MDVLLIVFVLLVFVVGVVVGWFLCVGCGVVDVVCLQVEFFVVRDDCDCQYDLYCDVVEYVWNEQCVEVQWVQQQNVVLIVFVFVWESLQQMQNKVMVIECECYVQFGILEEQL